MKTRFRDNKRTELCKAFLTSFCHISLETFPGFCRGGCVMVGGSRGVFYGWVESSVMGHCTGSFRAVGGEGGFWAVPKNESKVRALLVF